MTKITRNQSLPRRFAFLLLFSVFTVASALGCVSTSKMVGPTLTTTAAASPPVDPLPSWNDGAVKSGLLDFVAHVTSNGPGHVRSEDRIAVFDNDGTLWQEKPLAEAAFALARLTQMANADPSLRAKAPFKAALDHDAAKVLDGGEGAALRILTVTHTGMNDAAYTADVRQFLATARHPRFDALYTSLVYTPMVELLMFLRSHGFTTYICSAGDVDFMRTFTSSAYGIPPEQVIGSRFEKELVRLEGQRSALLRQPKIETLNDKDQKPLSIDRQIGKRPLFAAGNVRSGGDIAMLQYARDRPERSFALVINHDDEVRETAYAERDGATLAAAAAGDFTVVSMKRDWKVIFPQQQQGATLTPAM